MYLEDRPLGQRTREPFATSQLVPKVAFRSGFDIILCDGSVESSAIRMRQIDLEVLEDQSKILANRLDFHTAAF